MISVVIPTYNEEKNIENCLKSLLNQTLPREEYEIIVVDGQSKDKTVEIAKRYADKVIQQKSEGVGGARNDGVKISKGEIIATTDADCIVPRDWLERIKDSFKEGCMVCVYGQQDSLEPSLKNRLYLKIFNFVAILSFYLNFYLSVGANMAFRKKPFLEIGGYKEYSAGDDFELPFRLKKKGRIEHNPKMRVFFSMRRYNEENTIRVLINWFLNILKDKYGFNLNINPYNKKQYKEINKYRNN